MVHNLLVVDDCAENRFLISDCLSELPINIDEADSAKEALDLVCRNEYFAIIMDVLMPELDGFECAAAIRRNEQTAHIPIMFVTSSKDSKLNVAKSYELGAVDYMSKPVNGDILKSKIKVFLTLDHRILIEKAENNFLQQEKKRQSLMLDYIADGVLGFDLENRVTYANSAACTLLTTPFTELIGSSIKNIVAPNIKESDWQKTDFLTLFLDGQCNHCDDAYFWRNRKDKFPVQYTQSSIFSDGKVVGGMLVFQDVTERKDLEGRLLKLAKYDELTGLANRSLYWEFLQKNIEIARRKNECCYVLFIDLNRFKEINDTYGHDAGDLLLIHVSERLRSALRSADLICRLGGDEFSIVLQNVADVGSVAMVCEKIIELFKNNFRLFGHDVYLDCSIGVARFPNDGHDASSLTKSADTAMYSAKTTGTKYKFFESEMQLKVQSQLKMATDLRVGLTKKEVIPFYQMQYDLKSGKAIGAEALARWVSNGKNVSPEDFISVAEDTGLIVTLGQEMLISVGSVISAIEGIVSNKEFRVAVNISCKQTQESNFARSILQFFEVNYIDPNRVELEITETSLMQGGSPYKELKTLRNNGVKISVDDFGTGYSSLAYLKNLPLDVLKIDKSFISDVGLNSNNEKIIQAIIQLAHNLDLKVIAEGVETTDQLEFLRYQSCDYVQGYLKAKPCCSEDFIRLIKDEELKNKCGLH